MPLQIQPSRAELHLGQSLRFTASGPATSITWSTSVAPGVGTVSADGTFTASDGRPQDNLVTITATNTATGETASATVELVIPWPEGWPYLSDEEQPWTEPVKSWVARILYDVLSSLPPGLVRVMGPLPIRRPGNLGENVGGRY